MSTKEEQLIAALGKLTTTIEQAAAAGGLAEGGLVRGFNDGGRVQYRNSGGTIFKPRGTDTVPAMLTPGEFVIRKSAVDKIGAGNLAALNSGSANVVGKANGGVIYRRTGGSVTAANVGFVGQTRGASFMTGSTYKGALNDLIRSKGIGTLIKTLRSLRSEKGDDLAENVFKLYRAGKFDFSRLQIGDGTAKTLDSFASNAYLFSKADASGFEFATPPANVTLQDYVNQLNRLVAGFKMNKVGGDTTSKILERAYSQMGGSNIMQAVRMGRDKAIKYKNFFAGALKNNDPNQSVAAWMAGLEGEKIEDLQKLKNLSLQGKFGKGAEADKGRLSPALEGALNILRASGLYLNRGGKVPSYFSSGGQADTVPAMLTPGEFVMNKEAVQKYGINKMEQLNRGQVQGFNKGGLVGGVQYKEEGGAVGAQSVSIEIDPSRVQSVFDNFLPNFSGMFDNIVSSFSGIQNALTGLAQSMTGFTMQHNVTVEGLISIGGLNLESIKQELSTSIGKMVAGEVQRVMNEKKNTFEKG